MKCQGFLAKKWPKLSFHDFDQNLFILWTPEETALNRVLFVDKVDNFVHNFISRTFFTGVQVDNHRFDVDDHETFRTALCILLSFHILQCLLYLLQNL